MSKRLEAFLNKWNSYLKQYRERKRRRLPDYHQHQHALKCNHICKPTITTHEWSMIDSELATQTSADVAGTMQPICAINTTTPTVRINVYKKKFSLEEFLGRIFFFFKK